MRKFKINHASAGTFSAGQEVTDDQIAASAKAHHVEFNVDDWLKAEAVTEILLPPSGKPLDAPPPPGKPAELSQGTPPGAGQPVNAPPQPLK